MRCQKQASSSTSRYVKICVRLVKLFTEQACPLHARIVVRDFMLVSQMYSISISMEERQNIGCVFSCYGNRIYYSYSNANVLI